MSKLAQLIHQIHFASGNFLCICAIVTVIANALLLWNIRREIRKCFKTPTIYFIIGVCLTDLVTGLVVEPLFAVCYLGNFKICREYSMVFQILPPLFTNLSFLIILLLTWVQYLAISHPYLYKELVSKSRVIISELVVFAYSTIFVLLPFMGVPRKTVAAIDASFHSTFIPFLLIVSYLLILTSVRRHARRRSKRFGLVSSEPNHLSIKLKELEISKESQSDTDGSSKKLRRRSRRILRRHSSVLRYVERQFISMNLCLIIALLVCTLPTIIVLHLTLNWKEATLEQEFQLNIGRLIGDDILFLKFLLDPFIFALSFRKLRKFTGKWFYCCL